MAQTVRAALLCGCIFHGQASQKSYMVNTTTGIPQLKAVMGDVALHSLHSHLFLDTNTIITASILTHQNLFITLSIMSNIRLCMPLLYKTKRRGILGQVPHTNACGMVGVLMFDISPLRAFRTRSMDYGVI